MTHTKKSSKKGSKKRGGSEQFFSEITRGNRSGGKRGQGMDNSY